MPKTKKKVTKKSLAGKYMVWSDFDPNDYFIVDAKNPNHALLVALAELGWCVSAEPVEKEYWDWTEDES